tara:strand:- start:796 stop:1089 length:294 start_codon:yes stop_codon:yes gene_type:complete
MTAWTIENLERNTEDGGVVVAHWRCTAEDGEYTASSYGTVGFTPDASADGFISFDSLTEADVLGWVYAEVDQAETEAALDANIAEQKTPATTDGVPW